MNPVHSGYACCHTNVYLHVSRENTKSLGVHYRNIWWVYNASKVLLVVVFELFDKCACCSRIRELWNIIYLESVYMNNVCIICKWWKRDTPRHSCHRRSNGSTAVAGKSGRLNTTSSWPGSLWSPRSCRGEHGSHPLCPRPPRLQRWEQKTHTHEHASTIKSVSVFVHTAGNRHPACTMFSASLDWLAADIQVSWDEKWQLSYNLQLLIYNGGGK